jgi:phosphoserine phosphatase RsbU/P
VPAAETALRHPYKNLSHQARMTSTIGVHMEITLALVGVASLVAAAVWARSAHRHAVVWKRIEAEHGSEKDVTVLARSSFRKDLHTTFLYLSLAIAAAGVAAWGDRMGTSLLFGLVFVPVGLSVLFGRDFAREAHIAEDRSFIERKAEQVLSQDELAPKRWADRLAPEVLPDVPGFELGRRYQAGDGLMAGDFYDVFRVGKSRVAAVIGDVTGRGIEASITAFQAKYLLRVFLRQYRDPGQALEMLNAQMSAHGRPEEFISLVVVVFDTEQRTLRYASAGHPAAWLWHDRDVRPLRSTGPLLMIEKDGEFGSRELALEPNDVLLMYTDGLAEARNGEQMFGEERIANALRRDPNVAADVLCKNLLEAARDFASEPMTDDVAILAIRRH